MEDWADAEAEEAAEVVPRVPNIVESGEGRGDDVEVDVGMATSPGDEARA